MPLCCASFGAHASQLNRPLVLPTRKTPYIAFELLPYMVVVGACKRDVDSRGISFADAHGVETSKALLSVADK